MDASKSEAIEELRNLKEIEKQIALAEDTTREAENAIGNAKNDAQMAEKIALQAEKEAKSISKVFYIVFQIHFFDVIIVQLLVHCETHFILYL